MSVAIRLEDVLQRVQLLSFKKGENVLTRDGEAKGICIVDEGVLEAVSPGGETVLSRLLPGDFCGELSTVFGFSCTATVQSEHRQVDNQTKRGVCVCVCVCFLYVCIICKHATRLSPCITPSIGLQCYVSHIASFTKAWRGFPAKK